MLMLHCVFVPSKEVGQLIVCIINCSFADASIGFNEYNASVDETIRMYSTQLEITPPDTTIAVGFYVSVTYMNGTAMCTTHIHFWLLLFHTFLFFSW